MRKYIPKYGHSYMATTDGKIISVRTGKALKPMLRDGYGWVCLYRNGVRREYNIGRVVAIIFIPNPKKYKIINHINGKRNDNRVENLEWCTQSYNTVHALNRKVGKSGYIGVYRTSQNKAWRAVVVRNCKTHFIGYYSSPEQAVEAREQYIKKHFKF